MPFGSGGGGGSVSAPLALSGGVQPQLTVEGLGIRGLLLVSDDLGSSRVSIISDGSISANGGAVSLNDAAGTTPKAALTADGAYIAVHTAIANIDVSPGD